MQWKEIEKILGRDKEWADILEEYDRTGVMRTERIRVDFTLAASTVAKLNSMAKKTGKKPSRLLDEIIQNS